MTLTTYFKSEKKKSFENIEETDLTLYKEQGFITKLFNLIKGIFKKK